MLQVLLFVSWGAMADNAQSPLGINLRELRHYGSELHTVDFFKRAANGEGGLWLTQCPYPCEWNTKEQAQLDVDASGWPRSLPTSGASPKFRYVTTLLTWKTAHFPAGRWTVLYDGEGSLTYGFDAVRNAAASSPGRDAFDVAAPSRGITLSITATDPNKTGNYLRNIRVIPPGGTCNNDPFSYAADSAACPATFRPFTETYASQPFHPQFLSDMRSFSALRYVHFSDVITNVDSDWASRPQYAYASWGLSKGAPHEVALDLAVALNAAPWLEIPARADDNYVTEFARLTKSRYTGTRPIYLEYYNEAWNGAVPYNINGDWIQQQGVARWPASSESNYTKRINWFGMRTKQVCDIWKQVFSDQPERVKCIMGGQAANSWIGNQALACPLHAAESGGSSCAAKMEAIAIAPYLGGHIANALFKSRIEADWLSQADGGLSKLFEELTTGGVLTPPSSGAAMATIPQLRLWIAANKQVAKNHGVKLFAYEGGNELFGLSTTDPYQIAIQSLAEKANRDARMEGLYTLLFDAWKAAGGDLFAVYESTGDYSATRGNSALLEWTGQPLDQAPKYRAATQFAANNSCWWTDCALQLPAISAPPAQPTPVGLTITGSDSVPEGGAATFTATVTYSDGAVKSVVPVWTLSGTAATISAAGVLNAGQVSATTGLILSAGYSENGVSVSAGKSINITDVKVIPIGLAISGSESVPEGGTATYSATVLYSDGTSKVVVPTWEITPNQSATISAAGVLSAGQVSAATPVTLRAGYAENGVTLSNSKSINITDTKAVPASLTLSGSESVPEGGTATYSATVIYRDGTSKAVVPVWEITTGQPATISAAGVLSAASVTATTPVTLHASYTEQGAGVTASMVVNITDVPASPCAGTEPNFGKITVNLPTLKRPGDALEVHYCQANFDRNNARFDLYVAVQLPDASLLFLQCAVRGACSPTFSGAPAPYLANTTLPDGDSVVLAIGALQTSLPLGQYVFYAAPVYAGRSVMDSRNWIGALASDSLMLMR